MRILLAIGAVAALSARFARANNCKLILDHYNVSLPSPVFTDSKVGSFENLALTSAFAVISRITEKLHSTTGGNNA